jgi:tRNA pseudouridine38-40 synthase
VVSIRKVRPGAHCRFDAISREYSYKIYGKKDPFIRDRAYYFPYTVDIVAMREAAGVLKEYTAFGSFAKRNSQVKTFNCRIIDSVWHEMDGHKIYRVKANRFLRGMVRGLVGTMLQVGRKKISVDEFREIIEKGDSSCVDFSAPGHGLCLEKVEYAAGYFEV